MNEMMKLIEMLASVGAEFEVTKSPCFSEGLMVTLYYKGEKVDDAIWTPGVSHGWHLGLLETYYLNGCDGYETATEVFDGWEKMVDELESTIFSN